MVCNDIMIRPQSDHRGYDRICGAVCNMKWVVDPTKCVSVWFHTLCWLFLFGVLIWRTVFFLKWNCKWHVQKQTYLFTNFLCQEVTDTAPFLFNSVLCCLQMEDLRRLSEMNGASANMSREELRESSLRIETLSVQLAGLQKEVNVLLNNKLHKQQKKSRI